MHKVKIITLLFLSALMSITLFACHSSDTDTARNPNTLTDQEVSDGWELIFDGETLQGWRGLNMQDVPEKQWVVEDGALKIVSRDSIPAGSDIDPLPAADLLLDRPLNNFEFAFEWKLSPVANSGIKYNVSEELSATQGNPHSALGFEYQILDDQEYPQLEDNPSWSTSGLYELVEPGPNAHLNPLDEWNTGRIHFNGNYGEHWLNGERVLTFELGSEKMASALGASKWSDIKDFGVKHENAYIILQDHGNTVWYRNLKLRELP